MTHREIELIELIHHEAERAYWKGKRWCGSDYVEDCKNKCTHWEQCSEVDNIEKLLKEMKKSYELWR